MLFIENKRTGSDENTDINNDKQKRDLFFAVCERNVFSLIELVRESCPFRVIQRGGELLFYTADYFHFTAVQISVGDKDLYPRERQYDAYNSKEYTGEYFIGCCHFKCSNE